MTRERALAATLFSICPASVVAGFAVHEPAPAGRGISTWMKANVPAYVASGYFPDKPFGTIVDGLRNEDLERQTFPDSSFDLVFHLDIMEHLFDPFRALNEIYRTLKPHGLCLFTAPTEWDRFESVQVAFKESGAVRIVGEPEYHGNPQRPEDAALVTWRYGFDLPLQIQRNTAFDAEVRRFQSKRKAVMGYMNEVYILTRS